LRHHQVLVHCIAPLLGAIFQVLCCRLALIPSIAQPLGTSFKHCAAVWRQFLASHQHWALLSCIAPIGVHQNIIAEPTGAHQNIHRAVRRIPLFAPMGAQHAIVHAGRRSAFHHSLQQAHIIVRADEHSDFFVALTSSHQNIVHSNARIPLSGFSLQSFFQASRQPSSA
jgi:hypothetical protein